MQYNSLAATYPPIFLAFLQFLLVPSLGARPSHGFLYLYRLFSPSPFHRHIYIYIFSSIAYDHIYLLFVRRESGGRVTNIKEGLSDYGPLFVSPSVSYVRLGINLSSFTSHIFCRCRSLVHEIRIFFNSVAAM